MTAVHRDGDSRSCDASTVVEGNSSVYINGKLCSVHGDPNSHGGGDLITSTPNITVEGKGIIIVGDSAAEDALCPLLNAEHCAPDALTGSPDVFVG